eukprot:360716-Chlamydomonas_euryale.AAC.7
MQDGGAKGRGSGRRCKLVLQVEAGDRCESTTVESVTEVMGPLAHRALFAAVGAVGIAARRVRIQLQTIRIEVSSAAASAAAATKKRASRVASVMVAEAISITEAVMVRHPALPSLVM